MLYILEGARNTGKTTAIAEIKKAIGDEAYVIKFQRTSKPIPPIFMTDFLASHYLALIDSRSVCILDRFHLTEFVMRSLDKKVPSEILSTTTHMIDIMLKGCNAVTYILNASIEVRMARASSRDVDHRAKEWVSYSELDAKWSLAEKTFRQSKVIPWKHETPEDTVKLVKSIIGHRKTGKIVSNMISPLPPIIKVNLPIEIATAS